VRLRIGRLESAGVALACLLSPCAGAIEKVPPFLIAPSQLEAVFDEAMAEGIEHMRMAGAAAAVVSDGEILFTKGYGLQSLDPKIPVDPDRTLFRVGSITKTLTGTAIGQLLERGLVESIDDPANRYLKRVRLPTAFGAEVTIRHLLTHQAGFEDRTETPYRYGADYPEWTREYFKRYTPAVVRPPGSACVYSNAGIGFLGLLVSDVTGMTWADYVQRYIFDPVGMRTAAVFDVPKKIPNTVSSYAFFPSGEIAMLPNDWATPPTVVPAGSMAASAGDMARYMIAQMGGSEVLGIPPLVADPDLVALRFTRLAGNHPAVSGFGFVYFVRSWNGVDLAEHSGYGYGYRSGMTLIPEHRVGIFISATGETGMVPPLEALWSRITRTGRSIPDPDLDIRPPRSLSQLRALSLEPMLGRRIPEQFTGSFMEGVDLGQYVGEYWTARRNEVTLMKAFDVVRRSGLLPVRDDGDGGLQIMGRPGYKPIAPDVFWRDPSGDPEPGSGWNDVYAFRRGEDGGISSVTYGYGEVIYEPMSGIDNPNSLGRILTLAVPILLTGILAFLWPAGLLSKTWAFSMALLTVALPMVFLSSFADATEAAYAYLFAKGSDYLPFAILANVTWILALGSIPVAVAAWRSEAGGWRSWFRRAHAVLLVLGCTLLIVFFANTGLIGFNLP